MKTWVMKIELEFPVEDEDVEAKSPLYEEIDFSRQAYLRVQKHLEVLLENSPFEHYHVLQLPKR